MEGGDGDITKQTLFVAVRFGDAEGLPSRIPGLEAGKPIEAQVATFPPHVFGTGMNPRPEMQRPPAWPPAPAREGGLRISERGFIPV